MENASFHPLDYVSVLRRRMWWFITPVVLAIVVAVLGILLLGAVSFVIMWRMARMQQPPPPPPLIVATGPAARRPKTESFRMTLSLWQDGQATAVPGVATYFSNSPSQARQRYS